MQGWLLNNVAVLWMAYHCVAFLVCVLCQPVHSLIHPYISQISFQKSFYGDFVTSDSSQFILQLDGILIGQKALPFSQKITSTKNKKIAMIFTHPKDYWKKKLPNKILRVPLPLRFFPLKVEQGKLALYGCKEMVTLYHY